jgi:hypothetical protein
VQVVPVFAGGLDFSLPVRKFFYDPLGSGKAFVDCVVSLTGFALVGGPARQDAPKVPSTHFIPLTCFVDGNELFGVYKRMMTGTCPMQHSRDLMT